MALDQEDLGTYCIGQEGQCVHGGVGEVASHRADDGVVSAFVKVVEGPCVRMYDMVVAWLAWRMGRACEWCWHEPKRPGTRYVDGGASKVARSKLGGGEDNAGTIGWQWRYCALSVGVCWLSWLEGSGAFTR